MLRSLFKSAAFDAPASVVVFLVALPLCLGIALGSNAPLISGVLGGIIGGIVIGSLSGSHLSVSGPAAGLTVIVATAIATIGSYEAFLLAVVIAGVLQIIAGSLKLGGLGDYIPNAVIKGMLAAIGVLLILKQTPHLVGYDKDYEGDLNFVQASGENTFTALVHAMGAITPSAVLVGTTSLFLLWVWERKIFKTHKVLKLIPGPLVAVLWGLVVHLLIAKFQPQLTLQAEHLVSLPITDSPLSLLRFPDIGGLGNLAVWKAGLTLAIVASLETLLSLTAIDKLDPFKRQSPPNRELVAQGVGNTISGLLGGLPLTSVIVRSSANVAAGGRTRLSAILHGVLLLASLLFFARWLNHIPLAALAAILIHIGYKLAKYELFQEFFAKGADQFIPFVVTIGAIVFTDLLTGIMIGLAVGVVFIVRTNFKNVVMVVENAGNYLVVVRKDASFFAKPRLRQTLEGLPGSCNVIVDLSRASFIDKDVVEVISEYAQHAQLKNIKLEIRESRHEQTHAGLAKLRKQLETDLEAAR